MERSELISVNEFCRYYKAEVSFIHALEDSGLIEISRIEETSFIPFDEMPRIEKFMRMHYDLNINLEGLETVEYLLQKIELLQQKLNRTQAKVRDA